MTDHSILDQASMSGSDLLRIAIIDDHPIFRAGLRRLLNSEPGFEVVAEGSNGAEVPDLVRASRAQIVLIDLSMPGTDGLSGLRLLEQSQIDVKPVLLTANITREEVVEALSLGACGILLKSSAAELVFQCLIEVSRGRYWIDSDAVGSLVDALRLYEGVSARGRANHPNISVSELRMLQALARGASNKQIARELGIAEQTVKNSLSRLYTRFCATGRLELILKAKQAGLISFAPAE